MNSKMQVPVFICEKLGYTNTKDWDTYNKWRMSNRPSVMVELYKSRHTIHVCMGFAPYIKGAGEQPEHFMTLGAVGRLISIAREWSRNIYGCRFSASKVEIIAVPVASSGAIAEQIAQLLPSVLEFEVRSTQKYRDFHNSLSEKFGIGHGGKLPLSESMLEKNKTRNKHNRRRSWDYNDRHDPANWWKEDQ